MTALSAHLREAGGHGHLPFHPGCGVCRAERLIGCLPDAAVVPPRARASIAAALMAASTLPAAPVLAQEADTEQHGSEVGSQGSEPTFGDGREDLDPLVEDGRQLEEGQEEIAPLTESVREPAGDAEAPGSQPDSHSSPAPPPPTGDGSGEADESPAGREGPPQGPPPTEGGDNSDANPRHPAKSPPAPAPRRDEDPGATSPSRGGDRAPEGISSPSPPAALATAELGGDKPLPGSGGATTTSFSEQPNVEGGAQIGRIHVVQPGDSLWSIANGALGGDASPAQIARTVNSIWQLNATAIGTGDPDLIMVGTRLELP